MKKLMLIVGVLMIAGGISAHGYGGNDRDDRSHERVVTQSNYNTYALRRPEPIVHYNQYRRDCDRDRHCDYYRHDCDRDRYYDRDMDHRYYR